jgi:hypothetical protein
MSTMTEHDPMIFVVNGVHFRLFYGYELYRVRTSKDGRIGNWKKIESHVRINGKQYSNTRIIYKAFNATWDIDSGERLSHEMLTDLNYMIKMNYPNHH